MDGYRFDHELHECHELEYTQYNIRMIRSIRGSKWSIDFSEIRLPDEGDTLTVGKDRKKGESFA